MMLLTTRAMTWQDLLAYGEDDVAEWVMSASDDEFLAVCGVANWLIRRGPRTPSGNSMTLSKAAALAAVAIHDGHPRKLARKARKPDRTPASRRPRLPHPGLPRHSTA